MRGPTSYVGYAFGRPYADHISYLGSFGNYCLPLFYSSDENISFANIERISCSNNLTYSLSDFTECYWHDRFMFVSHFLLYKEHEYKALTEVNDLLANEWIFPIVTNKTKIVNINTNLTEIQISLLVGYCVVLNVQFDIWFLKYDPEQNIVCSYLNLIVKKYT